MRLPREDQIGFPQPEVIRVAGVSCIDLTHCYCLIWQQHVSLRSSWNHLMVCYLHLIFLFYPGWKTLKFGTCGIEATFIVSCSFLWKLIFILNLSESRIPWGIISGYVCETVYKLVRMCPPLHCQGIVHCVQWVPHIEWERKYELRPAWGDNGTSCFMILCDFPATVDCTLERELKLLWSGICHSLISNCCWKITHVFVHSQQNYSLCDKSLRYKVIKPEPLSSCD